MAGSPRSPLLLLAALALALALAVSPAAGQGHKGRLVGGLIDADVNEEGVQQALSFALSEYNKASNDAYHGRVLRVLRVRKQVRLPRRGRGIECGVGAQGPDGRGAEPESSGLGRGARVQSLSALELGRGRRGGTALTAGGRAPSPARLPPSPQVLGGGSPSAPGGSGGSAQTLMRFSPWRGPPASPGGHSPSRGVTWRGPGLARNLGPRWGQGPASWDWGVRANCRLDDLRRGKNTPTPGCAPDFAPEWFFKHLPFNFLTSFQTLSGSYKDT